MKAKIVLELEIDEEKLSELGITVENALSSIKLVESEVSDAYEIGPILPDIDRTSEFLLDGARIIDKTIV